MKRRRGSRGQGLVEFAIVLPIIVVAIFGIIDLGRAVFTYNALAQAARQAGRMAIVDQDGSHVRATAYDYAPTLNLGPSNVDVCFKDLNSSQQNCSSSIDDCPPSERTIGCLVIVTAHISYVPMTPIIGTLVGTVPLTSTSIQPIEYVCPNDTVTTCT